MVNLVLQVQKQGRNPISEVHTHQYEPGVRPFAVKTAQLGEPSSVGQGHPLAQTWLHEAQDASSSTCSHCVWMYLGKDPKYRVLRHAWRCQASSTLPAAGAIAGEQHWQEGGGEPGTSQGTENQ